MPADDNRKLGEQWFHYQDEAKGPLSPDLIAPGYRATINSNPMDETGHTQFAQAFYAGVPDLKHTIEDIVATDDQVVVRFSVSGTHTSDLMGIPPTNKQMKARAIAILEISGGKVTELNAVFDQLSVMQQIGAVPS